MAALSEYAPIELLRAARQGDKQAQAQLIESNQGLVWSIVRRFLPRIKGHGIDAEDLYQMGCIGLIKAIRHFDINQGTAFSTYAVPKIAGEIRRFLRDDGMLKVSRSIRENGAKLSAIRENLEKLLGRSPLLSELAEEAGLSVEEIAVCDEALAPVESMQYVTEDGRELSALLGEDSYENSLLEKLSLDSAVAALPEKEQAVIRLRFYKGLTQQNAARVLNVSQVQVSRLERRALEKLKFSL
ncbi:MAG TPA: sigma-70 family RNA polymerase sigma factor [Clostridiales bacterium]|jgi:RNA polymerase sporulation-specific sigma factor|nr:sigma-70 family RNA polymerase sigma factor [Clostridiales bacterium]